MFWTRETLDVAVANASAHHGVDLHDANQLVAFYEQQGYVGGASGSHANVANSIAEKLTLQSDDLPTGPYRQTDYSVSQIKAIRAFRHYFAGIGDHIFPETQEHEVCKCFILCFLHGCVLPFN
mmetsp:Transcript_21100/g.40093  ORF Transcript_21100/g.40093 Transcript_21100/m.40093 type:complete len:123 (-) Transcript_21100:390-758(-)